MHLRTAPRFLLVAVTASLLGQSMANEFPSCTQSTDCIQHYVSTSKLLLLDVPTDRPHPLWQAMGTLRVLVNSFMCDPISKQCAVTSCKEGVQEGYWSNVQGDSGSIDDDPKHKLCVATSGQVNRCGVGQKADKGACLGCPEGFSFDDNGNCVSDTVPRVPNSRLVRERARTA